MKKNNILHAHVMQKPFFARCSVVSKTGARKTLSHASLSTWQDMVNLIMQKKLTSAHLNAYVQGRIDARIDYWKNIYQEWCMRWGHTSDTNHMSSQAYKELCEIPLYVIHNPKITHKELLDAVFVFSDDKAKDFYCNKQGRSEDKWHEMLKYGTGRVSHGRLRAMYIQESHKQHEKNTVYGAHFPFYVLATIEHEITHCEQAANGRALARISGIHTRTIILMTNKGAHESLKKWKADALKQLRSSNNFSMEAEADMQSVTFHPNVWGLREFCSEQKKRGFESNVKEGYFSNDRFIALANVLLQERNDFFEYHDCMVKHDTCRVQKNNVLYNPALRMA